MKIKKRVNYDRAIEQTSKEIERDFENLIKLSISRGENDIDIREWSELIDRHEYDENIIIKTLEQLINTMIKFKKYKSAKIVSNMLNYRQSNIDKANYKKMKEAKNTKNV